MPSRPRLPAAFDVIDKLRYDDRGHAISYAAGAAARLRAGCRDDAPSLHAPLIYADARV